MRESYPLRLRARASRRRLLAPSVSWQTHELTQLEAVPVGVSDLGQAHGDAASGLADGAQLAAGGRELGDGGVEVVDLQIESRVGQRALTVAVFFRKDMAARR